jgi:hypothetical protein
MIKRGFLAIAIIAAFLILFAGFLHAQPIPPLPDSSLGSASTSPSSSSSTGTSTGSDLAARTAAIKTKAQNYPSFNKTLELFKTVNIQRAGIIARITGTRTFVNGEYKWLTIKESAVMVSKWKILGSFKPVAELFVPLIKCLWIIVFLIFAYALTPGAGKLQSFGLGAVYLTLIGWIWIAYLYAVKTPMLQFVFILTLFVLCTLSLYALWAFILLFVKGRWTYLIFLVLSLMVTSEIIILPNLKIFGVYFIVGFLSALWIFLTYLGIYWTYAVGYSRNWQCFSDVMNGNVNLLYTVDENGEKQIIKRLKTPSNPNYKMVVNREEVSILTAVQDGIFWMLLLGNRIWKYFAIAFGYVVLMMLPIFSSVLNVITLGILVPNVFIHSLVIAFELAFLPAIVLEIRHEMKRYETYKDYLKEETGRKLVTALGKAKAYKQS